MLISFSTPSVVRDEMYSMQCDVRVVKLVLYMNTFDVLILWKTMNPPMLPYKQKEMHFFSEKEANVSVNDVPLCY